MPPFHAIPLMGVRAQHLCLGRTSFMFSLAVMVCAEELAAAESSLLPLRSSAKAQAAAGPFAPSENHAHVLQGVRDIL